MAKLLFVFLTVTLVGYAVGLKCYHCQMGKDCMDLANTKENDCGKPAIAGHEMHCIKKIVEDNATKKQNISRGCVLFTPNNPNELCQHKDTNSKQIHCETCNKDLCNDSAMTKGNVFTMVAATLSIFFARYILY